MGEESTFKGEIRTDKNSSPEEIQKAKDLIWKYLNEHDKHGFITMTEDQETSLSICSLSIGMKLNP